MGITMVSDSWPASCELQNMQARSLSLEESYSWLHRFSEVTATRVWSYWRLLWHWTSVLINGGTIPNSYSIIQGVGPQFCAECTKYDILFWCISPFHSTVLIASLLLFRWSNVSHLYQKIMKPHVGAVGSGLFLQAIRLSISVAGVEQLRKATRLQENLIVYAFPTGGVYGTGSLWLCSSSSCSLLYVGSLSLAIRICYRMPQLFVYSCSFCD